MAIRSEAGERESPAPPRGLPTELCGARAMWAVAAQLVLLFVGSTLPTPLYVAYQRNFHFSEIALAMVFAAYACGALIALFFLGRLSDQIGRRAAALIALGVAAGSTIAFVVADSTAALTVGRALSGISVGIGAGTSTAWIAELHPTQDKARATVVSTVANVMGLAIGPLVAGVLAQYAPWPLRLVFVAFLLLFIPIVLITRLSQETVESPVSSLRRLSLRPRIGIPKDIRAPFVSPGATAFAIFAFTGFYTALIPSMLVQTMHQTNHAISGAVVGELFVAAAVVIAMTQALDRRRAMLVGIALIVPSLVTLVLARDSESLTMLLLATALGGVSLGLGYRGSLQVVNELAPGDRRAEVLSTYMVCSYAGLAIPVVGVGIMSEMTNAMLADTVFAVTIAVFAAVALFFGVRFPARK